MNSKIWRTLFFILLSINIIVGIVVVKRNVDNNARNRLKASLSIATRNYNDGEISVIDFSKITNFAWDKLYIFGPYTYCEAIRKDLDVMFWPECGYTNIEIYDNVNLLIFTKDGHIVQYLVYPKDMGNFVEPFKKEGYTSQEALFIITKKGEIVCKCTVK